MCLVRLKQVRKKIVHSEKFLMSIIFKFYKEIQLFTKCCHDLSVKCKVYRLANVLTLVEYYSKRKDI